MENNLTKCIKCLQEKQRILVGKFASNNKKYEDENGKKWVGMCCPLCHKNRIREAMKVLRLKRKLEVSLKDEE